MRPPVIGDIYEAAVTSGSARFEPEDIFFDDSMRKSVSNPHDSAIESDGWLF